MCNHIHVGDSTIAKAHTIHHLGVNLMKIQPCQARLHIHVYVNLHLTVVEDQ